MIVGRQRGWRARLMPALFLAPAVVLFAVFCAGPTVSSLYVCLCKWTGFTPTMKFTGVRNFVMLAQDERFWNAIVNNVRILVIGGVGLLSFAAVFAAALHSPDLRGRKFLQTMLFFPAFISVVGAAVYWKCIYDMDDGLANLLLGGLGVKKVAWLAADNAIHSVIVVIIWGAVGGTMILLLAGMRRIPKDYYEAAQIDGAGDAQQFRHVTVPMMREVLIIALSLWMISAMRVFGHVQALLAPDINDQAQVVSTLMYEYAFSNRRCIFMMGRATAMAVVQVAMVLTLVGLVRLLREKESVEY
jgi:ABC-type sugar transport system permease subunit